MKLRDVIIDKDLTIEMLFYKHVDNNFSLNMKIIFIFNLQVQTNVLTGKSDQTHSSEYYIKYLFVL